MAKPLIITISHSLGRAAAATRLKERVAAIRQVLTAYHLAIVREEWTGDRLDFGVVALGQRVDGAIDVADDVIRLEVRLPWLLASFAARIQSVVQKKAPGLLGPPSPRE